MSARGPPSKCTLWQTPKRPLTLGDRIWNQAERLYFGETLDEISDRGWRDHYEHCLQREREWNERMARC